MVIAMRRACSSMQVRWYSDSQLTALMNSTVTISAAVDSKHRKENLEVHRVPAHLALPLQKASLAAAVPPYLCESHAHV